jgi:hypothetical protein
VVEVVVEEEVEVVVVEGAVVVQGMEGAAAAAINVISKFLRMLMRNFEYVKRKSWKIFATASCPTKSRLYIATL